ncbi:PRC-barrel domain containing protein [Niveispirillum sp. KHB5.9]|uniref:PRC-barrel domain containing protein n=1 Tax=Niveispirillum sp. KHB5.9 TaxID=3400269 RepID=UPI003A878FE3
METIAGVTASIATMVAAAMTAANLGARVTGWGFVVFLLGSVCWSIVGLVSDQADLLATNAFLAVVNLVGVWRWLGRQRTYEEGGRSAERASRRSAAPTLFTGTGIAGLKVRDDRGILLGKAVEALLECASGRVSYVVVATSDVGGLNEQLRAVSRDRVVFGCECLAVRMSEAEFTRLATLEPGEWPVLADSATAVSATGTDAS